MSSALRKERQMAMAWMLGGIGISFFPVVSAVIRNSGFAGNGVCRGPEFFCAEGDIRAIENLIWKELWNGQGRHHRL